MAAAPGAGIAGAPGASARVSAQARPIKPGAGSKLSAELSALHAAYQAFLSQRTTPEEPFRFEHPFVRLVGDRVVIDAVAAGDGQALLRDLEALGLRSGAAFGRMVSGQLPVAALGALSGLESLRFARSAAAKTHGGGGPGRR